jgi:Circularly permutated YpsA SLOG family
LHLCSGEEAAADKLKAFIDEHGVKVLNVAGPRVSNEPEMAGFVSWVLDGAFAYVAET